MFLSSFYSVTIRTGGGDFRQTELGVREKLAMNVEYKMY